MYFPKRSNSRFTREPFSIRPMLVCSYVYGMIATSKRFFLMLKIVRLIPLRVIEPLSTIKAANSSGNSNSYPQLPFKLDFARQIAVQSICPCTKWPSNLLEMVTLRSKFTLFPETQSAKEVLNKVSAIAVTR